MYITTKIQYILFKAVIKTSFHNWSVSSCSEGCTIISHFCASCNVVRE